MLFKMGCCYKRQRRKRQSVTAKRERKVANAKGLNGNTNLT